MLDIRNALINKNMTHSVLDYLEDFLETAVSCHKLLSCQAWKSAKPKPSSHYRRFDMLRGVALQLDEIARVKDCVIKRVFNDDRSLIDVVVHSEFEDLSEKDQSALLRGQRVLFMNTKLGKEYAERVLCLEDAVRLIGDIVKVASPYAIYTVWTLHRALKDARYDFFYHGADLEVYSRAVSAFVDVIQSKELMVAGFREPAFSIRKNGRTFQESERSLKNIEKYLTAGKVTAADMVAKFEKQNGEKCVELMIYLKILASEE